MVYNWLELLKSDKIYPMKQIHTPQNTKRPIGLFDTIADDVLHFGIGSSFNAKKVPEILNLKREDISRITSVSVKSVRYDDAIPDQMKERLEEIANTINMVAKVFNGDIEKTIAWFKVRNPLLGDVSPRDMIRLGRYERLRKFIINAMSNNIE
jgi:Asp-tRNA(Asn)/Glu-tRNA(Gln) amidotransferase C subunit